MVSEINVNWLDWSGDIGDMQYYHNEKPVLCTSKEPHKTSETPTYSIHSHPYVIFTGKSSTLLIDEVL